MGTYCPICGKSLLDRRYLVNLLHVCPKTTIEKVEKEYKKEAIKAENFNATDEEHALESRLKEGFTES